MADSEKAESERQMVERHVAIGKRLIGQQRALIAEKRAKGRDTSHAEDTLEQFQGMQRLHEQHLARLQRK